MSSFKSKLLNGFIWRLCLYGSSFILNIFIAHSLGAEKSGVFYLLLNNIAFIVLFLSFGIDSAVAYYASRKEVETGKLVATSILWSLLITALLIIAYFIGSATNLITDTELAPYIIFNIGSVIAANCISCILFALEDNKTPNLVFTVMNVALIILLIGLPSLQYFTGDTVYIKLYLLVTALPAFIFTFCLFAKKIYLGFKKPDRGFVKKFFSFALRSFLYSLLYALLLRCDYWLVNYYCDSASLGNYLQATKLAQVILLVPSLASFSLFPLIVSHIHEEKKVDTKLIKLVSIYFYIGLVICLGVVAVGYWVFPWLYGKSFVNMYSSFVLLSPGILALAAVYPLVIFYSGKNLISRKIIALVFSIAILLVLDFLLIPLFDIFGAAISSTLAYCFYFFYLLFHFRKIYNFKLVELLKIKTIIKENTFAILSKKKADEN